MTEEILRNIEKIVGNYNEGLKGSLMPNHHMDRIKNALKKYRGSEQKEVCAKNLFDDFPDSYRIEQGTEIDSGADIFYVYHDKAEEWRKKWEPVILEALEKAEKYIKQHQQHQEDKQILIDRINELEGILEAGG